MTNLNDRPKFLPGNDFGRKILQSDPYIGFDSDHMWLARTGENSGGWVILDVIFPTFVTLDHVRVYTQHSGQVQKAAAIMIGREKPANSLVVTKPAPPSQAIPGEYLGIFSSSFEFVALESNPPPNADLAFEAANARTWRFFLKAEANSRGRVTVRGLRFYHGGIERFPIPFYDEDLFPDHLSQIYEIRYPEPPIWPEIGVLLRGMQRDQQLNLLKLLMLMRLS